MQEFLNKQINDLITVISRLKEFTDIFIEALNLITECFSNNNKILLCGNGGSAAEAQHIAAEYVSSLRSAFRRKSLPAIALTTDTSFITAASNDFGYESIFERQIESLGNEGDILIAISTSGNSKNVLRAIRKAKEKNMKVIGLTGESGGQMIGLCDVIFNVSSSNTMRLQECHLFIEHTIVELVENKLFGEVNETR